MQENYEAYDFCELSGLKPPFRFGKQRKHYLKAGQYHLIADLSKLSINVGAIDQYTITVSRGRSSFYLSDIERHLHKQHQSTFLPAREARNRR